MTKKSFLLIFNLAVIVLLVSCGLSPLAPAVTPSPTFVSSGPLSAAFMRSTYRLGDTLEFTVRLENNDSTPVTTSVSLTLESTYVNKSAAEKFYPRLLWSKTQDETLEPGEKRTLTWQIPFDLYRFDLYPGTTGLYELTVQALGAGVRAETSVISVFDVQVTYPKQVQAGQTINFQAVITNLAGFDVHEVEVFDLGGPVQSLGTLPAHSSKMVTFTKKILSASAFASSINVRSSDGGDISIISPEIPFTPVPTPTMAPAPTDVPNVLDVKETLPEQMQIGQTIRVQLLVINTANFDVHDVVLFWQESPPKNIDLMKVSGQGMPAQPLGTLPAHSSKTVTFTMIVPNREGFATLIHVKSSNGGKFTRISTHLLPTPVPTP